MLRNFLKKFDFSVFHTNFSLCVCQKSQGFLFFESKTSLKIDIM